ncbi:conserved hypothetical protein [Tenacibaculum maritimum]|uniref:tetratricopeptide repeat protein n=1 Tax=Tenacibaculum maritimum TaxID=107401 RepID=UPI0012E4C6AB|nr:hypothetical protein [Tenacibaculum maritimum]CAA0230702.1 conserved hypothetical protein [Tenacibaculum maritimum]
MKKIKRNILIISVVFISSLFLFIIIYDNTKKDAVSFQELFNEGYFNAYMGKFDTGNKKMLRAISKLKKPNAEIYRVLSILNTKNGNYDIAISALEKAYKMNPEEIGAYYGWVLLYYYHDYHKALTVLNNYDDSTPNFNDYPMGECIHYLKGLAYKELKNYEYAIKEFDISIKDGLTHSIDWISYQVFLNKGITLFYQKKYGEAIYEFKRAIKSNIYCSEAYYFIGLSEKEIGIKKNVCKNLKKALNLIQNGYKDSDLYVELSHEVYEQEVIEAISKNCN